MVARELAFQIDQGVVSRLRPVIGDGLDSILMNFRDIDESLSGIDQLRITNLRRQDREFQSSLEEATKIYESKTGALNALFDGTNKWIDINSIGTKQWGDIFSYYLENGDHSGIVETYRSSQDERFKNLGTIQNYYANSLIESARLYANSGNTKDLEEATGLLQESFEISRKNFQKGNELSYAAGINLGKFYLLSADIFNSSEDVNRANEYFSAVFQENFDTKSGMGLLETNIEQQMIKGEIDFEKTQRIAILVEAAGRKSGGIWSDESHLLKAGLIASVLNGKYADNYARSVSLYLPESKKERTIKEIENFIGKYRNYFYPETADEPSVDERALAGDNLVKLLNKIKSGDYKSGLISENYLASEMIMKNGFQIGEYPVWMSGNTIRDGVLSESFFGSWDRKKLKQMLDKSGLLRIKGRVKFLNELDAFLNIHFDNPAKFRNLDSKETVKLENHKRKINRLLQLEKEDDSTTSIAADTAVGVDDCRGVHKSKLAIYKIWHDEQANSYLKQALEAVLKGNQDEFEENMERVEGILTMPMLLNDSVARGKIAMKAHYQPKTITLKNGRKLRVKGKFDEPIENHTWDSLNALMRDGLVARVFSADVTNHARNHTAQLKYQAIEGDENFFQNQYLAVNKRGVGFDPLSLLEGGFLGRMEEVYNMETGLIEKTPIYFPYGYIHEQKREIKINYIDLGLPLYRGLLLEDIIPTSGLD